MSADIEFDAWQRSHFASIMAHMRAAGNNDPVLSGMIQSAIKGAWQAARATPSPAPIQQDQQQADRVSASPAEPALRDGSAALGALQRFAIQAAQSAGAEMFLGIPDGWYEPNPNYGCENGHVSRSYLKSEERGNLCLECQKPIAIIPPGYTDATLAAALADALGPVPRVGGNTNPCKACNGEGVIHTGIDEAPASDCRKCDGSGLAPTVKASQ